ncbi:MAG: riboflavin synthase [Candidatus Bathyarchaeia archaeon]
MKYRVGLADTTFARVDMAKFAVEEIKTLRSDVELHRYTVPGIKDLPVAAKILLEKFACDVVLAFGMPGALPLDKQSAHEASMGLIWSQLLTNKHVIVVFVHEDEAKDDKTLYVVAEDRSRKHARNAVMLLAKPEVLTKEAGMGKRQGQRDVGPIRL